MPATVSAQPEPEVQQCGVCGNFYASDSIFCRNCGAERATGSRPATGLASSQGSVWDPAAEEQRALLSRPGTGLASSQGSLWDPAAEEQRALLSRPATGQASSQGSLWDPAAQPSA